MREAATRSLDQSLVNWLEQRIIRKFLAESRLVGESLLDVPCGYGRFWGTFADFDLRLVGIDRDPEMIQKAACSPDRNGHSHPLCGSVFALPFEDDSFDCVTCIRLLHLRFSDLERLSILRELTRVSRRFVIISIYQPTPLHGLWRHFKGTPDRLRFTTSKQLSDLLLESGLELRSSRPLQRGLHMQTFLLLTKATQAAV
ncbi:MAG: class I SAM-dependent methyltransferase [Acidobacteriota bacterium]|jgi:ubiquinone/menaquinone biosynthesis C-methylase UbiE